MRDEWCASQAVDHGVLLLVELQWWPKPRQPEPFLQLLVAAFDPLHPLSVPLFVCALRMCRQHRTRSETSATHAHHASSDRRSPFPAATPFPPRPLVSLASSLVLLHTVHDARLLVPPLWDLTVRRRSSRNVADTAGDVVLLASAVCARGVALAWTCRVNRCPQGQKESAAGRDGRCLTRQRRPSVTTSGSGELIWVHMERICDRT